MLSANCAGKRGGTRPMCAYKVMVDDNFHYMEEDERWELGTFRTAEEAIDACRKLVDQSLLDAYQDDATADKLFEHYTCFGEDPFIIALGDASPVHFSAWTYARQRAAEFTAAGAEGSKQRQTALDRKRG